MSRIRLIAGLGNPGRQYEGTPHNVGARWVRDLAARFFVPMPARARFRGSVGRGDVLGRDVWFLVPSTYMNLSGDSVCALSRFYGIEPDEILIAHDEVDFPVGVARLKNGGRHHTHNGLASVVAGLGSRSDFVRLRIGIGHPGRRRMIGFLTGRKLGRRDRDRIDASVEMDDALLQLVIDGELDKAMSRFHAPRSATE
ncbi:MAG: aminoacyl-tRNA hydrolase [Rhodospirillales bacterium]|nr:aminoacyl-tRNA hydrolase [Rhodospirillales bacterium]